MKTGRVTASADSDFLICHDMTWHMCLLFMGVYVRIVHYGIFLIHAHNLVAYLGVADTLFTVLYLRAVHTLPIPSGA